MLWHKVQGAGGVGGDGWSLTNAAYSGVSFSASAQDTDPRALFFGNDGFAMYVTGATGDDVIQYALTTAWDISTASYIRKFSVASREGFPGGLFFKPDGLKMYVLGAGNDNLIEYALSTAWDISTASHVQNRSVVSQDTSPRGMFFREDGARLYISGDVNEIIIEYSLSTAWDISTTSLVRSFSVSAQDENPVSVFFKPDGLKMYVCGSKGDDINEYALSTAWNISTASFVQNFSVSSQATSPWGLFFKPDGLKMYVADRGADSVFSYDL
jgi:DNA-binding beta-propeller fold protein YncE